jgi:hypothetical protein
LKQQTPTPPVVRGRPAADRRDALRARTAWLAALLLASAPALAQPTPADLTRQALAGLRFRLSEHWTLGAGYRYVDTDYDSGSGDDRKPWSMVNEGPDLGAQIGW